MKFVLFFLIYLPFQIFSKDIKIICETSNKPFNQNLNQRFSKIIDFENRTVENLSGQPFDNLVVFNNYEIVMNNEVYDYMSSFNIGSYKWLVYDKNFIDVFKCAKRR
tara:strand:+ start:50 stop:370 length:321 start_codon:yes stop_codon:yes gene_type:complete